MSDDASAHPQDGPVLLYVDDEHPNRVVFKQSFGRHFPIVTAASGAEAKDIMQSREVAVLVTDQRMPGMSGNELLEWALEHHPRAVRIVITAYSDLDAILQAINRGLVARYLVKPWSRPEVHALLDWALQAYGVGNQNAALQIRVLENERLATLGSVAAAVFHDLAHPVSYLLTNSEILDDMSRDTLPELQALLRERADVIPSDLADRLNHFCTELLELSADMVHGAHTLVETTAAMRRMLMAEHAKESSGCEPIRVVRYVTGLCEQLAQQANCRLQFDGPADLPRVSIASSALTRVLINVINNGIESCRERTDLPREVKVYAEVRGHMVHLDVIDNGLGMDKDLIRRLQSHQVTTKTGGSGIGVQQSRKLVEEVGGSLAFESERGHGTRVSIEVPVEAAGSPPQM